MVRTRFAPSPTGYLHIGGVRTALFNWLFARQQGGQFILRIDDTDQQRNLQAALQPILDGFRWLGLQWDEGPDVDGPYGPYFQSQRLDRYRQATQQLLDGGHAYRDYALPEELQRERELAEREKRAFVYSRRWLAESDQQAEAFEAAGHRAVVRLKMPREGKCEFRDLIRGEVEFAWAQEQDHVIQRADGSFLYHLATVVDDRDLQVTHVIRAEEHLSNTPRQIFIAQGLGARPPQFAHLPYVAEPGGKNKLSKRKLKQYLKNPDFKKLYDQGKQVADTLGLETADDTFNPVLVDFYREIGFLPDAVINYLLLLGWSLDDRTEDFTREQMLEHFSLQRVNRAPASFDPQKLLAFQTRHMQGLPAKQKVAFVIPFLQQAGLVASPPPCDTGPQLSQIVTAAGDRLRMAGDILDYDYFFLDNDQFRYDEKAFEKRLRKPAEAPQLLAKFRDQLAQTEPFEAAVLDQGMQEFVQQQQIKIGQIIHAVRVAVTGRSVGFGLFETLEILGRDCVLARLDRTLSRL